MSNLVKKLLITCLLKYVLNGYSCYPIKYNLFEAHTISSYSKTLCFLGKGFEFPFP